MFNPGGLPMAPIKPPSTSYMPRPELPSHLQSLFNPRPPLTFMKVPAKSKCRPYTGVADYLELFEEEAAQWPNAAAAPTEIYQLQLEEAKVQYNPRDSQLTSDPFKTLFVCRLSYSTTEKQLKREFEVFGPVKSLSLIRDLTGRPRGHAFVEFENEVDYKNAYKYADGKVIDGKKVLVDFERGRTTKDWLPRRLGGGKGDTRKTKVKGEKTIIDNQNLFDESRGYKPSEAKEPEKKKSRSRSPRIKRETNVRNKRPLGRYDQHRDKDRERPRRQEHKYRRYEH